MSKNSREPPRSKYWWILTLHRSIYPLGYFSFIIKHNINTSRIMQWKQQSLPTNKSKCTRETSHQKQCDAVTTTANESNDHRWWMINYRATIKTFQSSICLGGHPWNSPATDFTPNSPSFHFSMEITVFLVHDQCLRTSLAWATDSIAGSCQTFGSHHLRRNSWAPKSKREFHPIISTAQCRLLGPSPRKATSLKYKSSIEPMKRGEQ